MRLLGVPFTTKDVSRFLPQIYMQHHTSSRELMIMPMKRAFWPQRHNMIPTTFPNKEKYCIAPPREDNVHLLDRGGVQYDPTRTSHSIGGLRQRKNKHGAETHVFVLAGVGKFSTIMDWNEHPSVGYRVGVHCITQALWRICDTFPALSRENFNAASGMIQTRLIHNHKYFKKGA